MLWANSMGNSSGTTYYLAVGIPYYSCDIPAWSLHRMIEMMPYCVEMYNKDWCLQVSKGYVRYASIGKEKSYIGFFQKPNTFDAIIDCIEWLIKEGYFNKEYLV